MFARGALCQGVTHSTAPRRRILFGGGGYRERLAFMGEREAAFPANPEGVFFFFSFFRTKKEKECGSFLFPSRFCLLKENVQSSSGELAMLGAGASSRLCVLFNEILLPLATQF